MIVAVACRQSSQRWISTNLVAISPQPAEDALYFILS
jgi:hypothetical protein